MALHFFAFYSISLLLQKEKHHTCIHTHPAQNTRAVLQNVAANFTAPVFWDSVIGKPHSLDR